MKKLAQWLSRVDQHLEAFHRGRPGDLLRAMAWHVFGFSLGIFQIWLFLGWMGRESSWILGVSIWFLGAWCDVVGFIVPAGIGVQEGSRVLIFDTLGLTGIAGFTFGIVLRVTKAFWALVGLGCYGLLLRGMPPRR
jgi:hypothetical protein